MRKRISERNVLPGTDWFDEYQKLEFLFSGNKCIGQFNQFGRSMIPKFTLEQYFPRAVVFTYKGINEENLLLRYRVFFVRK